MWDVQSFQAVGPLKFGQDRAMVRELLGDEFRAFSKGARENEADAYDSLGLHLYYNEHARLEFVEVFSPAQLAFAGVSLLDRSATEVVRDLQTLGHESEQDDVGYNYDQLGIGLTVRYEDTIVEGVAVFKEGYYD